jgi:hypothetical protein
VVLAATRTLYYQDRSVGSSELSFRFQPGAAATQRPASEINAFTTGYTESAVLLDVMCNHFSGQNIYQVCEVHQQKSFTIQQLINRRSAMMFTSFEYVNSDTVVVNSLSSY